MGQRVLLAGATGYIGARLARELLAHGYALLCPVRSAGSAQIDTLQRQAPSPASLHTVVCDPGDAESLAEALKGQRWDVTVSCIASRSGGVADSDRVEYRANLNLLRQSEAAGARHFTLLSAICVQKPALAFQFAKLRFEGALLESGIPCSIVRPTAFFKSLSGQLERVRSGKPFLAFGDGELTRCKAISEGDLAHYLRLTLEDEAYQGILPIGGPGPALTPRMQAELLGRILQREVRVRTVPPNLLRGVARILDIPGRFAPRLADKAEFARIGHYYATESMLLWDARNGRYDEDATPEFGTETLEDSYRAQIAGREDQSLGEHGVF